MNDDVRDVIARIVWTNHVRLPGEWPYEAGNDLEHGIANDTADAILTALADKGYVVVERERFERVRCIAAGAFGVESEYGCPESRAVETVTLFIGDLEPLPERGE